MQSQSVSNTSGDRAADLPLLPTADLADRITPSVFQVLCYRQPEVQASARGSSSPTNLPSPLDVAGSLIDARGYDAIGFDYNVLKGVSFGECHQTCEAEGKCKAITYNAKHRACFLKDNVVALIRNADAIAAYSSTKAASVIVSDFASYSGVDLPGGDYKRVRHINYLECFTSCIGETQCLAFSYIPKKSECWLKSSIGKPRAAKGVELGIK